MNKKELATIEKQARRIAQNSFEIVSTENEKGRIAAYGISLDGHIYWSLADLYEQYPELKVVK